jgi:hypothetical protein
MKLRGRPEAPDQAPRAHNLHRARGADTQAVHGPLQRLLEDVAIAAVSPKFQRSTKTTIKVVAAKITPFISKWNNDALQIWRDP